ncbi:hypothetical protein BHS05_09060 [Myxococcus xanthus]|nr:hypothetical protein BHS05_09060 [Myxococcus xanthus]QDF03357.1 hypothetical protein BHS04_09070 [Myxococcus xanthus]
MEVQQGLGALEPHLGLGQLLLQLSNAPGARIGHLRRRAALLRTAGRQLSRIALAPPRAQQR